MNEREESWLSGLRNVRARWKLEGENGFKNSNLKRLRAILGDSLTILLSPPRLNPDLTARCQDAVKPLNDATHVRDYLGGPAFSQTIEFGNSAFGLIDAIIKDVEESLNLGLKLRGEFNEFAKDFEAYHDACMDVFKKATASNFSERMPKATGRELRATAEAAEERVLLATGKSSSLLSSVLSLAEYSALQASLDYPLSHRFQKGPALQRAMKAILRAKGKIDSMKDKDIETLSSSGPKASGSSNVNIVNVGSGSTVHGGVITGQNVRVDQSIHQTEVSKAISQALEELRPLVEELVAGLDGKIAKKVADDFTELEKEVLAENPDREWCSVTTKGLLEAAKFVGTFPFEKLSSGFAKLNSLVLALG